MTQGADRPRSLRFKLVLLFGAPLLVLLATGLGAPTETPAEQTQTLDRGEERLHETFGRLLENVARIASAALDSGPRRAWVEAQSRVGRRVEGVGILGPDGALESWEGMPAEPPPGFAESGGPAFAARADGVRTRLFVASGPDRGGRLALVTFIVDSTLDDLPIHRLLPDDLRRDVQVSVDFDLSGGSAGTGGRLVSLLSPEGEVLAVADLMAAPGEGRARRSREVGRGWAAVLFVVLLAFLFDWKTIREGRFGLLVVAGALVFARALLLWQNAMGRLLPRELGSPSVYGSSKLWGLLESPADLFLTALAVYLLCFAIRRGSNRSADALGRIVMLSAAAGVTAVVVGITLSLARNSRIPLLERPAPFEWDARLLLWLGLLLPILGAAQLWGSLWPQGRRDRAAFVPVALVVVLLCAGASVLMQQRSERMAAERLGTEVAPLVLEQETWRELALTGAMQAIVDDFDPADLARPEYLAYRQWVGGELFHSNYKSSLDFYTPEGEPLSHFGFGLPPLDESVASVDDLAGGLTVREEWIDQMAAQPWLLHAETPIVRNDEVIAVAVGHVLDEPDNLPFLPWSQTYLSALGPGVPERPAGAPHYVLYDDHGGVRLTTLLQPPAETGELRGAAASGISARIRAGDEPYLALPLEEADGRLHVLMLPRWTLAERLGAIVRLALLGLAVLGMLALIARASRPGGLRGLVPALRGSFYRKLLAALLLASIVPLVGLALFLRGYLERRGDAALNASATQFVSAAQRVIEDYSAGGAEGDVELTDDLLHWLRRIVGQEIHVYRDSVLQATSTRELFDSGLLPERLDGAVRRRLVEDGLPHVVAPMAVGPSDIPVAYAPVRELGDGTEQVVVAVPLVLEQREIARGVSRVAEMILLATVVLVGLLAVVAALVARTVARPVRDLVDATGKIAAGDYATRLEPHTRDEVAELVQGFNTMASALAGQRADLERRRDYIETLLRHATTGVISLDAAMRVVTLNPAAEQLLASAPLEVGADFEKALAGSKQFEPLGRALGRARPGVPVDADLAGETQRRLRGVRVELQRADGESFGTLILIEDVTELMRSNQLAAWAEMARSIAHEIKNPLTPIQLSTEHLARLLHDRADGATEQEQACIETIIKQVRALYDIAGEFSAYAKLPVLAPRPTDPVEFMREVVAPYRAAKPPGIEIHERYDAAPPIAADPKVLSRAVINLIENALQAMPEGGTLTVGVVAAELNGKVELSVADSGPGLDPGVRRRLFEPYFSTKSSGTGLGLAIVRRAVEAHGGTIEVSSGPERGTTFRIQLPRHC